MSLYNLINGVNQCTFWILPMLGKHPDQYPRFRDCFIYDPDREEFKGKIHVYTRTGGGNREEYQEAIDEMRSMPTYVTDYDDAFDPTYATWVFDVPDRWKADFEAVTTGNAKSLSDDYKEEMKRVYPKLTITFDELFAALQMEKAKEVV